MGRRPSYSESLAAAYHPLCSSHSVLGCPLGDTASLWSSPNMVAVAHHFCREQQDRSRHCGLYHSGVWGEKAFSALQSSAQPALRASSKLRVWEMFCYVFMGMLWPLLWCLSSLLPSCSLSALFSYFLLCVLDTTLLPVRPCAHQPPFSLQLWGTGLGWSGRTTFRRKPTGDKQLYISGEGEHAGQPDGPFPLLLYFSFLAGEGGQGELDLAALNTCRLISNENIAVVIKNKHSTLTPSINTITEGQGESPQPSKKPMTFLRWGQLAYFNRGKDRGKDSLQANLQIRSPATPWNGEKSKLSIPKSQIIITRSSAEIKADYSLEFSSPLLFHQFFTIQSHPDLV